MGVFLLFGYTEKNHGLLDMGAIKETHGMPADLRSALIAIPKALRTWDSITPLARNEWICWVISGKKAATRDIRITKALSKLAGGMRRPCCWAGCPHR